MAVEFTTVINDSSCLYLPFGVVDDPPLTMMAFFNVPSLPLTSRCLVKVGYSWDRGGFGLHITGNDSGTYKIAGVASFAHLTKSCGSAAEYTTSTWHHAAAIFAGLSSRKAALDGVFGAESTGTLRTQLPFDMDRTGISEDAGNFSPTLFQNGLIAGCLAHVAIWNIALSEAEVLSIADGTFTPDEVQAANLVFYAPLADEATATTNSGTSVTSLTLHENSDGIATCATSPGGGEPEPEPEPEPTPTPGSAETLNPVRLLKPYEKPPIAEFGVGDARSKFPLQFFVFEGEDLRVTVDEVELALDEFSFTGNIVPYPGYDDTDVTDADYHRKQASVPGFKGGIVTLDTAVEDCVVTIWNDPQPLRGGSGAALLRRDLERGEFNGRIAGRMFGDIWATYRAQKLKFSRCVATADATPLDEDLSGTLLIQ